MKTKRTISTAVPTPKDVAQFTNTEPPAPKPQKDATKIPKKPEPQALVGGMGFYPGSNHEK